MSKEAFIAETASIISLSLPLSIDKQNLESIRRKPLSERTMELSQKVGIALLGTLMVFVFYNDIVRLVHRWMAS